MVVLATFLAQVSLALRVMSPTNCLLAHSSTSSQGAVFQREGTVTSGTDDAVAHSPSVRAHFHSAGFFGYLSVINQAWLLMKP